MRVAVFTDADLDRGSGVATMLEALLRHAPSDVQVRLYTLSDLDVDEPGYLALRSPALPLGGVSFHLPRLRELRRRLIADGITAIHTTTPGIVGLAGRVLARRLALPLVGSVHRWPPTTPGDGGSQRSRLRRAASWYVDWIYRPCVHVLAPSVERLEHLATRGWRRDRLSVWPAGVDLAAYSPSRRSQSLRNDWHVSDRRPAILWIGRLTRGRGIECLEPVGSLLHRQGIAHRFIVVGDGPDRAAVQESCPDGIFTGRLAPRELAAVMASADLLVAPGDVTASGMVLLEAQASGLPVIVDDAARDHIRPGGTGALCRRDDVLGVAARAAELIADAGRRRSMGEAARRFAERRPWHLSLDRVYTIYRHAATIGTASAAQGPRASTSPDVLRAHR
jgi:glycosyltransferase involved in cell wall biosynthesis